MLQEPMMEKLTAMRLLGIVDALKAQEQDPASRELGPLSDSLDDSDFATASDALARTNRRSHRRRRYLDRLVHHAHRIEMRCDSMRKNRAKPAG